MTPPHAAAGPLDVAVGALPPITLEALDARAALQRRTDRKYLVPAGRLTELTRALARDHRALEIEGTRVPSYESVYFDTADLRCFTDHVAGRTPRFKIRSRLYVDTQVCSFEVKVKQHDETVKGHLPYASADHGQLTGEAKRFVADTVERCDAGDAPADLAPALTTTFRRATLAADDGSERVTVDAGLRLTRPDGTAARLPDDLLLVEVKSESGEGRCDHLLHDAGVNEVSLSKYRTGIALLTGRADQASDTGALFQIGSA